VDCGVLLGPGGLATILPSAALIVPISATCSRKWLARGWHSASPRSRNGAAPTVSGRPVPGPITSWSSSTGCWSPCSILRLQLPHAALAEPYGV